MFGGFVFFCLDTIFLMPEFKKNIEVLKTLFSRLPSILLVDPTDLSLNFELDANLVAKEGWNVKFNHRMEVAWQSWKGPIQILEWGSNLENYIVQTVRAITSGKPSHKTHAAVQHSHTHSHSASMNAETLRHAQTVTKPCTTHAQAKHKPWLSHPITSVACDPSQHSYPLGSKSLLWCNYLPSFALINAESAHSARSSGSDVQHSSCYDTIPAMVLYQRFAFGYHNNTWYR